MRNRVKANLIVLVVAILSLVAVAGMSHAAHAAPKTAESCTWTLEASNGPLYYNGSGYQNITEYVYAYADLCTGTGWNGSLRSVAVGDTGASSECNYAFSSRMEENDGVHINPAGQASTSGCFDSSSSRDGDDTVTVTQTVSFYNTGGCPFDASVYVSAFFNETYGNSGSFCP